MTDLFGFLSDAESFEETVVREVEDVFYAHVDDPLAKMQELGIVDSKEFHEQWEIKSTTCRIRVRKTVKDNVTSFEITKKVGDEEHNEPITEFVFNCYKEISESGMIKDRYTLKVQSNPDAYFEFDCFINGAGQYHPWIKIDLEIPEGGFKEQPIVPEIYTEIISGGDKTKESVITDLYSDYFLTTK